MKSNIDQFLETIAPTNPTYPYINEALNKIYPTIESKYTDIVNISGAVGIGKTHFATLGIIYDIVRLIRTPDPRKALSILPDTPIYILIQINQHDTIIEFIHEILNTYFKEEWSNFKCNNFFILGFDRLNPLHGLGGYIYSVYYDLANEYTIDYAKSSIQNIITKMRANRNNNSSLRGTFYLVNNLKNTEPVTEMLIDEYSPSYPGQNQILHFTDLPAWVKSNFTAIDNTEHGLLTPNNYFHVDLGDETTPPRIVEDYADYNSNYIKVPNEYKDLFKLDILTSIREFLGRHIKYISPKDKMDSIQIHPVYSKPNIVNKDCFLLKIFSKSYFSSSVYQKESPGDIEKLQAIIYLLSIALKGSIDIRHSIMEPGDAQQDLIREAGKNITLSKQENSAGPFPICFLFPMSDEIEKQVEEISFLKNRKPVYAYNGKWLMDPIYNTKRKIDKYELIYIDKNGIEYPTNVVIP